MDGCAAALSKGGRDRCAAALSNGVWTSGFDLPATEVTDNQGDVEGLGEARRCEEQEAGQWSRGRADCRARARAMLEASRTGKGSIDRL